MNDFWKQFLTKVIAIEKERIHTLYNDLTNKKRFDKIEEIYEKILYACSYVEDYETIRNYIRFLDDRGMLFSAYEVLKRVKSLTGKDERDIMNKGGKEK